MKEHSMSPKDKGYKGMAMEGPIAAWYARTTQKDSQRHAGLAQELVQMIPPGGRVLEVAPGPGYLSIALARLGLFRVNGLDISQSFVEIARKNAAQAGVTVDFQQGNASEMPFDGAAFDFIVCQAAFKNFSQPVQAIAEMHRVLEPGGTALIIDLRRDAPLEAVDQGVASMGVGRLNRAIVRWTFHNMLLKRAYRKDEIERFIAQTPFQRWEIEDEGIGFRAWLRKGAGS
jgi:ubiquinone/menaquinone biosynthesis C-methylase UbiE